MALHGAREDTQTDNRASERAACWTVNRTPPACAQPRAHGCLLPLGVCLGYGLATEPRGSTAGTKAWTPDSMSSLHIHDSIPRPWHIPRYLITPGICTYLMECIKDTQDESRAARLCTEQNLGGRWGFHSSYVTHPCEASGRVSDEGCTLAN